MSRHLISGPVSGTVCPRCRRPVLVGLAEGRRVTVDATPVGPAGELAALVADRESFALLAHCRELVHRHAGRIRAGLVGAGIHLGHRCTDSDSRP